MKRITYLCLLVIAVCSCSGSTKSIDLSLNEIREQEMNKNLANDTIFLGFNFKMDSIEVINHCEWLIKDSVIWDFYATETGRMREFMQKFNYLQSYKRVDEAILNHSYSYLIGQEEPNLYIDYFGENLTFFTNLILTPSNDKKIEECTSFGIVIYRNKLRSIYLCFTGDIEDSSISVNPKPFFDMISKTFSEKYGIPQYCYSSEHIWIKGDIEISLKYDGIKQTCWKNSFDTSIKYYPYYILKYQNNRTESLLHDIFEKEQKEKNETYFEEELKLQKEFVEKIKVQQL